MGIVFSAFSLTLFLRIISMVVSEREDRIIENMENMGMKKVVYITSSITYHVVLYLIYGIIISLLFKALLFKKVNFFLLYVVYVLYMVNFILIAFFISSFFKETKKAIILGIIIFFILFMFFFL